jgi:hypothetical protein
VASKMSHSDGHSKVGESKSVLQNRNDEDDTATWKGSISAKVRNIWLKYGSFCQDVVVQITYFVPAVVVATELQDQFVGDVQKCSIPNSNNIVGSAIEYNRNQRKSFASFSGDFFLEACKPFWSEGNKVCWNIFVAAIFFHQITFVCINTLKVSSANSLALASRHIAALNCFAGIANRNCS